MRQTLSPGCSTVGVGVGYRQRLCVRSFSRKIENNKRGFHSTVYLFICLLVFGSNAGFFNSNMCRGIKLACCTLSVIVPVVSNDLSSTDAH